MLPPHGGTLVDRVLPAERQERALDEASELPRLRLSDDLAKDIENIAFGAFSPLEGFLCQSEYESVLHEKRLSNDLPWTLPIVLDASKDELKGIKEGDTAAIIDHLNEPVALLDIEEIFDYKKE